MSNTLQAAVIGLGVGEQHIAGYEQHPGCRVVALADTDPAKLAEVAERHPGRRTTTEPDELLTDPAIDVVSIASYDDAHAGQVCTALRHGKHVFVEKPLCLFPDEAREIRRELNAHPELLLSSNLILRKCPRFEWLRQAIANGELGEIFYVEADYDYGRLWKLTEGWRGRIPFYSVYYGGGVHMVDLLLWLLGRSVTEVSAQANSIATRGTAYRYPDLIASLLRFDNDVVGKVTANFASVRPHFHRLAIYGTKATFFNQPDAGLLYRSRDPDVEPERIELPYPGYHKGQFLHAFVEGILTGSTPEVSGDEVFRAMSICFAVEQAVTARTTIPVDYL